MVSVICIYIIFEKVLYVGIYIYRGDIVLFVYIEIIYLIYFSTNKGDWELWPLHSYIFHLLFVMLSLP